MRYYSTNHKSPVVSFKEAVLKGLPDDNGLYMPETIPRLSQSFWDNLNQFSFTDIAREVGRLWIGDEIPITELERIIHTAFDFPIPLIRVEEHIHSLELYHGPTMAFKDFGARFMALTMEYFARQLNQKLVILVATSGDTGSAVAHGFLGQPHIDVVILYPGKKISLLQEKQLTTLGHNIKALEINGTFDDCQKLVKDAFLDPALNTKIRLSSANSINIARLIPQSFYYFYACQQLKLKNMDCSPVISVPSGNFGNLTAALLAKQMGLPVHHFIAATNTNDVVPYYLNTGRFAPRPSQKTISNAMDVGNPSNFARMEDIYGKELSRMEIDIKGYAFDDQETRETLKSVWQKTGYLMDPHGTVGYLGLRRFIRENDYTGESIFVETAHPAKFREIVEPLINQPIPLPPQLAQVMEKEKHSIPMENDFNQLKEFLLETYP